MTGKRRLSVTVDAELVEASQAAVAVGSAESVSAWVNALDEFLAGYEAEHGEITDDEMAAAVRRARERAVVVRGDPDDAHGGGAA
jgi:hypothetical protein